MINLTKSQPAPECLEIEKKKKDGNYRCGEVLPRLKSDFFNKCYVCEFKATSLIVEHFIPHKEDKDLKFDWNNLFLACDHCNRTKGQREDALVNCTNPTHDALNWMKYEIEPFPELEIKITPQKDAPFVKNTVELLRSVYNGKTDQQKMGAENLREHLLKSFKDFQESLDDYYYNAVDDKQKSAVRVYIINQLMKSSPFTAFKRWIIKENPKYREDFETYFD